MFGMGRMKNIEDLATNLGCQVDYLPSSYLGLLLGAPYKRVAPWDSELERVHNRLARWKGMLLSEGGKVVLANSVLSSLSTYYLSLFVIPRTVATRIEKCQREFIWGKGKEKEGIHLVAWDDICKPKHRGGLGIVKINKANKALLSKWLWHFWK